MKHMKNGQEINTLVSAAVEDLTNVEIDNLTDGQGLKYDSTLNKWVNANIGSGSANIDEMTQLEYDVLPDTKLSDDVVRFAYYDGGTPQLDPDYTYVTYGQDDEIIVRIYHEGEADEEVLWFLRGFYVDGASGTDIPNELQSYLPTFGSESWITSLMYPDDTSTTPNGACGFQSGTTKLFGFTSDWQSYQAGTYWGVIDIAGVREQHNEYYDPYVYLPLTVTRHIYLNGRQYSGEGGSGSDTNVTQTEISTNDDYEVLLSGTADDQTRTEGANKSENVKVNPSTGNVTIAGTLTDKNGLQTVRSLTGAEYDALSSAEKNNGTYYHITDRNSTNVLDVNVSQTATSTDATYEVLFSGSADNVTKVEGARKNSNLTFNPSTGSLGVGGKLTVGAQPTNNMDVTTKQYVDNLIDTAITQVLDTIY